MLITIAGESQTYLSDGSPTTATVEYSQQDIEAGISIKPTGSGAVHITAMHSSALPRVVYFNYLTPAGELLGQKFVDASNNEEDHFFIKDHLGNIRVTLSETGAVLASEDFYPYGKVLRGMNLGLGAEETKYKFSAKELDGETNLSYFGARYYDGEIGRWWSVDPLSEQFPGVSSFAYALNNPIRLIDKGGMLAEDIGAQNTTTTVTEQSTIVVTFKFNNNSTKGTDQVTEVHTTVITETSEDGTVVSQTTVVVSTTVEVDATGNVSSVANRSAVVTVVQNTPGGLQTASGAQALSSVNVSQTGSGLQTVANAVAQFKQTTGISPVQA
ncbi:MAG: RHS repeat-associated core domain-containing protein, partial [Methanobacteriota archaeon]